MNESPRKLANCPYVCIGLYHPRLYLLRSYILSMWFFFIGLSIKYSIKSTVIPNSPISFNPKTEPIIVLIRSNKCLVEIAKNIGKFCDRSHGYIIFRNPTLYSPLGILCNIFPRWDLFCKWPTPFSHIFVKFGTIIGDRRGKMCEFIGITSEFIN